MVLGGNPMRGYLRVLVLVSLAACHGSPSTPPPAASPPPNELQTTDGTIAVDNLSAAIDGAERLAQSGSLTAPQRAAFVDLLATRGQFLGRIADYERATDLAEALVHDVPTDGVAWFTRAKMYSTWHRFGAALADLDTAESLGLHGERIDTVRSGLLQATGRYDDALTIRRRLAETRPDLGSLGALATLYADRGELDDAEREFESAPQQYRDASPFPVAWLEYQRGVMWMRHGDLEKARTFFAAAHSRLPEYAAAQGHLAEVEAALGERPDAIMLLQPLASSSDDPDYAAHLARILADAGAAEESRRWRDSAAARYERLMAEHPEAFADHAAEFWVTVGGDAPRALAFAQKNLEGRHTPRAYELLLEAALAAHAVAPACDAAAHVRALAHPWPKLLGLADRAAANCLSPATSG